MDASELHGRTLLVASYEGGERDSAQYRFLRGRGHSQPTNFLVIAQNNAATIVEEDRLAKAQPLTTQVRRVLLTFLAEDMLAGVEYFISSPPRSDTAHDEGWTIYAPLQPKNRPSG